MLSNTGRQFGNVRFQVEVCCFQLSDEAFGLLAFLVVLQQELYDNAGCTVRR
jgi:hypothetical protein